MERRDLTPSAVQRLRDGDSAAGRQLDELYREAIVRFCRGYVTTIEDAEDATQEIFARVLRAAQVPDDFRAWLYRVARNHCLNALRDRRRRGRAAVLPSDVEIAASLTGDMSRLARGELRSRVMHLVAGMPPASREVLRLRYSEGLSRDEIAYVLDVPLSVVKSRLFKGVQKLRDELK